jgi:tetratricopeptide (TPR) repeat protein
VLDYLARSLSNSKRYDEAARLFRQLAESPDAPAVAWQLAAEAHAGAGQMDEAEAAYDAYLQRNPGDLAARTDLGELYIEKKAYPKAVEQFRLVLSTNPNYGAALKGMGLAAARQDNLAEALEYYDRVLRSDRRDGEAMTGKAFVLFWMDRLQESKELFLQVQRRYPRNSEVARALQRIERRLNEEALAEAERTGDVAEIERQYRARLDQEPNDAEALKFMAGATSNSEECRESIEYGERGLILTPDDPELVLTLAESYALCERYDESYQHYQNYRRAQKQAAEKPLAELGWAMLRADRQQEAVDIFENVLSLNPDNTRANLGLARVWAAEKRYDEALTRYDAVLAKNPDHYDALQAKGLILYWTGAHAEARAVFEQLAQRKPDDSTTQEVLASLDRREEAARWERMQPNPDAPPDEFVAYYQKRLEAYPDDASAMRALAYNQGRLRNYDQAIHWYEKSLEIEPDHRSTRVDMARIHAFARRYDESIRLYRELLDETPEDVNLLESLARVYTWNDQDKEALDMYQRLLVFQPRQVDYWLAVIRLKMNMGDYQGARQNIRTVLDIDPSNRDAQLYLAQMSLDENQRQEALAFYDALLAENPDDGRRVSMAFTCWPVLKTGAASVTGPWSCWRAPISLVPTIPRCVP